MGSMSLFHWVIVGVVVLLLFGGRGKISGIMGDFAKGIKAFKKGMNEDEQPTASDTAAPAAQVPPPAPPHPTATATGTTAQAHPRS
jgi:sec-independent protein translocase protein TatA